MCFAHLVQTGWASASSCWLQVSPSMVTYDTSTVGAKAETERGPEELLCPNSPVKPSHSSSLGTCYIECAESPGIQATLPSNQSTHLKSPMENSAEPGAPLTCTPCVFPSQPCWHIQSHTATGMRGPSRAAKLSDVRAANAALLRTRLSPLL